MFKLETTQPSVVNGNHISSFLEYFNTFELIPKTIHDLGQFHDGVLIEKMLREIANFQIPDKIEENPNTFSTKFINFKQIMKAIQMFWQNILGLELQNIQEIDLVEIVHHRKHEDILKVLELLVKTAIQAENREYFIEKILVTSETTQQFLKAIVEKTIGRQSVESPRKQKEKRMFDKILQLDHQNDKLQQVISIICEEKYEVELKNKQLIDQITEKNRDLDKLKEIVQEYSCNTTPQKKYDYHIPDTKDKNDALVEILKLKAQQMQEKHTEEIKYFMFELEEISEKLKDYQTIENQLKLYKETASTMNQQIQSFTKQKHENQYKLSQQNTLILQLTTRVNRSHDKILKLEEKNIDNKLIIEKKAKEIDDLNQKLQFLESKINKQASANQWKQASMQSFSKTLSFECPQIISKQYEALLESNQVMRGELEKQLIKSKASEEELIKKQSQMILLSGYEKQNQKLIEIISQLQSHRGEENQILTGVIFEMRKIMFKSGIIKETSQKQHRYVLEPTNRMAIERKK